MDGGKSDPILFRPDTVCLLLDSFCSPHSPPPILQLTLASLFPSVPLVGETDSTLSMAMGYKAMSVMRKVELREMDGGRGPGLGGMQGGVTI